LKLTHRFLLSISLLFIFSTSDIKTTNSARQVGLDFSAINPNTLVIVTAFHETGGMSIVLNPTGAPDEDGPVSMPNGTFFYVNWGTTGHTDTDVPATAYGNQSDRLTSMDEDTKIFNVIRSFIGWEI
jgi:alkaline phosphatase